MGMKIDESTIRGMTLDDMRRVIGLFLDTPAGAQLWDLMAVVRGPDSPSERGDMSEKDHAAAYAQRRARKRATGEVVRERLFFGHIGGAARHRAGEHVTLPPIPQRDHYDHHIARVVGLLGLTVKVEERKV